MVPERSTPADPRGRSSRAARALLLALALAACGAPRKASGLPVERSSSRVDVFLRAVEPAPQAVELELASVRLREATGGLVELALARRTLASGEAERRLALAGAPAPPGTYTALVLELRGARLRTAAGDQALALLRQRAPAEEEQEEPPGGAGEGDAVAYEVPLRLALRARDAASLYVDWNVSASLAPGAGFLPVLSAIEEVPQVALGRLWVTDAGTGSVLGLDPTTGEVTATRKVGDDPRALAVSGDLRNAYVVSGRDGTLSVVDLRRNLIAATIPVRLGADTCDVVVGDPDRLAGRLVFAPSRALDIVSFFDVVAFARIQDVRVGRRPVRLAVSGRQRRLFVANSLSNDVSVLDVNSRSLVATVPVEAEPVDLTLDFRERELFVAHRTSPNLVVIDADTLAVSETIWVGPGASAVLADRRQDRIYLARSRPPELCIVDRRLKAIVRRTPVTGEIVSLSQSLDGAVVYGAAPGSGGIVAVDVIRCEEQPFLPCGRTPTDVVVVR